MAGDIFEIDKSVVESILVDKTKIQTLSYPARRVLYAGRASGRWFTKSEATYDEIMALYKGMDKGKKQRGKPKSEVSASDLGVSEEELRNFLTFMEKLLVRKG